MRIELITPEQHKFLHDTFTNFPALTLQNKGYEYIRTEELPDEEKQKLKEVSEILRKSVAGFSSFSNFRLDKNGQIEIRLQYNYNYGTNDRPFTGVGYILLDELLNGFSND